jgi:transposase, IS5 family
MSDGQGSFAEAFLGPGIGRNRRLERIAGLIEWSEVESLARQVRAGRIGRPPHDPLAMVKALLLQQWYGLSDPGLEEALLDRVSFRRFCGFAMDGATPDETTICRFRGDLAGQGLAEKVFAAVLAQLDANGLILREGTIVDATLIEAGVRKPATGGPGAASPTDPDAAWTKSGPSRRAFFGYKAHVATDKGSGLIRRAIMTPANIYESTVADALIEPLLIKPGVKAVYADKAYEKKERRAWLKSCGVNDRIMHRANKHQPELPRLKAMRNRLITPIRAAIERTFAVFKERYGWRRVRYRGLGRNSAHLMLIAAAFNLRRAEKLLA